MSRHFHPDRGGQLPLFEIEGGNRAATFLSGAAWPESTRFPVNYSRSRVRDVVWSDLVGSSTPLLIAGFSSLSELVHLVSDWSATSGHDGARVRLVFGAEPFTSAKSEFRSVRAEFTDIAREYWLEEQGISLRASAQVLQTIEALERGLLSARFIHGSHRLHAKIFVGENAATVGSSNFTRYGLGEQYEANARFDATHEPKRYRELVAIAENYWAAGESWDDELRQLLHQLLRVVTWEEALARACANLLEGDWASRYLAAPSSVDRPLWPSQRSGIAEALWISETVGSVLIADATGSGKTLMGAHLVRAARDRLLRTGRARRDLTVLVGPPAVIGTWKSEAIRLELMLEPVSHGILSRAASDLKSDESRLVRSAQILAVDEAHNFLNHSSMRTRQVLESLADNVMLFTATPISRGASDLLDLVGLLGPDNFEDRTLDILNRLDRRRGLGDGMLLPNEIEDLRREIQRFTVRRTKAHINEMVDRNPDAFVHPITNRVCRYPEHRAQTYGTQESDDDARLADQVRDEVNCLVGIAQLEREIGVPKSLRSQYSDEQWLQFRLHSSKGLARHHVLEALRSSRAAAIEHLAGTQEAARQFAVDPSFKTTNTGDVIAKLRERLSDGPPMVRLTCEVEPWLVDPSQWQAICAEEIERYERVLRLVGQMSNAREMAKVDLLARLAREHDRVLAFDRHPVTLALLSVLLSAMDLGQTEVLLANSESQRRKVTATFAPDAHGQAIALCSDAMNEGLNLQGASCIAHLDLPTTLRVAEQRVGRVDRMDSPYDTIEAWWPQDGPSFATRAYEKLVRRARESTELLGSNLTIPDFGQLVDDTVIVTAADQIAELSQAQREPWDGIQDALEPIRQLVSGPTAIVSADVYDHYRTETSRVMARVAPLRSRHPWAFFSIAAAAHGAPRWLIVDQTIPGGFTTDLFEVAARLRILLDEDPQSREFDDAAADVLDRCLDVATVAERQLLPKRMIRALSQMEDVISSWAVRSRKEHDEETGTLWAELATLASPKNTAVDPYLVAERWLEFVSPYLAQQREETRRRRYILLRDVTARLQRETPDFENFAERFTNLPASAPLDERVTACILGVPEAE